MKTQVLSKENASVNIIGLLLLVMITSLGCGILSILSNAYPVMRLDPVILTQGDLRRMRLTESDRLGGFPKESSIMGC